MTFSRDRLTRLLVAALAVGVLVLVATAPSAAAHNASRRYVAIGDSFSAGVGTHGPITDACYRSPLGYPPLVAEQAGWQLDYQACSGATTADVLGKQLGTLSPKTDVVTIGVGGNDALFGLLITACPFGKPGDCEQALAAAHLALSALPTGLDAVYHEVATKAPNAQVAVVGYPRLFDKRDCSPYADVTPAEMSGLNAFADELDAVLRDRAHAAGFRFVDVRDEFDGHAICTERPYIHTYVRDPVYVWDSFHPKQAGYRAYARAVLGALDAKTP